MERNLYVGHPRAKIVGRKIMDRNIRKKRKTNAELQSSRVASHEKPLNYFRQALVIHWGLYHKGKALHNQEERLNNIFSF